MSTPGISAEQVRAFLDGYASAFWPSRPVTYTLALFDGELKIVQVCSESEQPKFLGVVRARG